MDNQYTDIIDALNFRKWISIHLLTILLTLSFHTWVYGYIFLLREKSLVLIFSKTDQQLIL